MDQNFFWRGHFLKNQWQKNFQNLEKKEVINPSRGTTLLTIETSKDVAEQAVAYALLEQVLWQKASFEDKKNLAARFLSLFLDSKELLLSAMAIETGKPHWECLEDFSGSAYSLKWFLEHNANILDALKFQKLFSPLDPDLSFYSKDVVIAYLPFASALPQFISIFCSTLLTKCSCVFFFPKQNTLLGGVLGNILEKLSLPINPFQIVFSDFEIFRQAASIPQVSTTIYTGSKEHCAEFLKNQFLYRHTKLLLESGSKNTVLVHSSANIDDAVRIVKKGLIKSCGQRCTSTARVFVYEGLFQEFRDKLIKQIDHLKIGPTDTKNESIELGPLYNKKSVERFLRFQKMAQREAKETLLRGRRVDSIEGDGFFVLPGIHEFSDINWESAYEDNILLSPDLALYQYDVLDEVIEKINHQPPQVVSFVGSKEILEKRSALFCVPNIVQNLPTVEELTPHPLALGHFQGFGYAFYFMSPQMVQFGK